ncbi:hypothetical protein [Hyalangium gracile]|uniref:hypothetical protein n=1 Tax=Hyalangium gracile TaxID=394092 RepID=UPI001CCE4F69|nr:hypothetical protein [Hyalangium gracile]
MGHRKRKEARAPLRAWSLCGLGLLALGVAVGACRDSIGTALYVTIDFPPSLQMDQLLVTGTVEGDGFGPHVLPEEPERLLTNGDTFRVLLSAAPDDAEAKLSVEGLRQGARIAVGTSEVRIQEGDEVDVTVRLEPAPTPDGGVPDGGTPDGGFCPNCASGCCMNNVCTTSTFNTCGSGGIACVTCERKTADSCGPQGVCSCGQGPACDPAFSDQCTNGQCKCGNGPACGFGQTCVGGKCVCNPSSCGGCCFGNLCAPGNSKDACGRNGVECAKCRNTCGSTGTCS